MANSRVTKGIMLIGLFSLIVGITLAVNNNIVSLDMIISLTDNHRILAPIIYSICYALAVITLTPTLPLNLGAGFLWGPVGGTMISLTGLSLGAAAAFLISRYCARDFVTRTFSTGVFSYILKDIHSWGWKVVCFTRINPVFPFSALNYAYGTTSLSFKTYWLTTMLSIIPGTLIFASVGSSLHSTILEGRTHTIVQTVLLLVLAVTFVLVVPILAKRYWKLAQHSR